jgi:alkanesulfonate monooxygenase SsuD/methylene tetrahydromethanopterin reductase-like flavin-dependent oxidoreductase (luciferase family)
MIRWGLGGLSAQSRQHDAAGYHRALRGSVELAVAAESAGFDGVWVTEHHFVDDGYLPAPLIALAAIAERTSHVQIGTQVLLAPLYSPLKLAEDAAVLDQLSGGRLVLGVGLGYQDREYAAFGVAREDRVRLLRQCASVARMAWAGHPIEVAGHEPVTVRPLPFRAGGPPLWIGAIAEGGVRRAAHIGDGFIAPMMSRPGFERRLGWLQEEGLDSDFTLGIYIHAFVGGAGAWGVAADGVRYVERQYARWQSSHRDFNQFRTVDRGTMEAPPDHLIVGTPDAVADRLRPWCRLLRSVPGTGERQVIVRLTYPGISDADAAESVRLFGSEVVAMLRGSGDA